MANKGANGEREFCKILSKGIQGTEKPYLVGRGAGSGSMVQSSDDLSGDVHSINPKSEGLLSKFSFELKNGYPQASFDRFLSYHISDPISSAWRQACASGTASAKLPILVFKKKGMKCRGMCSTLDIKNDFKLDIRQSIFEGVALPKMFVISFEEFLSRIKYETFENYYK